MSDEFEGGVSPFKATLKAGGGYEAPWLTVAADNAEELSDMLDTLTEDVLQKIVDVGALLRAAHTALTPAVSSSGESASVTPINGEVKTCDHGVREYREGTNRKTNKSWAGWFCPLEDKNAQCKPMWKD